MLKDIAIITVKLLMIWVAAGVIPVAMIILKNMIY